MNLQNIFTDTKTRIFKVANFYEEEDCFKHIIEPTEYDLIPAEYDMYFYIRALQVYENKVVECFMDMSVPERISEFVIKQIDNKVVVESIYDQKNSVIPAMASEQYGDPELYYAKQNPMVGLEILKKGKLINPKSEAIIDDIAYIYEELGKNLNKKKIKTPEDAVEKIIASSILQHEFSLEGNFRASNKHSQIILKAIKFLIDSNNIELLLPLLQHEKGEVKFCASVALLETKFQNLAIKTLAQLENKSIKLVSLNAKYTLMELRGEANY